MPGLVREYPPPLPLGGPWQCCDELGTKLLYNQVQIHEDLGGLLVRLQLGSVSLS